MIWNYSNMLIWCIYKNDFDHCSSYKNVSICYLHDTFLVCNNNQFTFSYISSFTVINRKIMIQLCKHNSILLWSSFKKTSTQSLFSWNQFIVDDLVRFNNCKVHQLWKWVQFIYKEALEKTVMSSSSSVQFSSNSVSAFKSIILPKISVSN